jgi:hypothetical protein
MRLVKPGLNTIFDLAKKKQSAENKSSESNEEGQIAQ